MGQSGLRQNNSLSFRSLTPFMVPWVAEPDASPREGPNTSLPGGGVGAVAKFSLIGERLARVNTSLTGDRKSTVEGLQGDQPVASFHAGLVVTIGLFSQMTPLLRLYLIPITRYM